MTDKKPEKPLLRQVFEASSIGIHLVVSTFVGFIMGYGLDSLFGTYPYLTFIFLILGIIAGFRELLKIAKQQEKN